MNAVAVHVKLRVIWTRVVLWMESPSAVLNASIDPHAIFGIAGLQLAFAPYARLALTDG
jgi:hypothetical protein